MLWQLLNPVLVLRNAMQAEMFPTLVPVLPRKALFGIRDFSELGHALFIIPYRGGCRKNNDYIVS